MSQAGFKAGKVARAGEQAVEALRKLYGKRRTPESREAAKAAELADFARGFGAPLKTSESRQNAGELVFDRDTRRGNAGRVAYDRLWTAVWGEAREAAPAKALRVSAAQRAAAAQLLALCGGDRKKAAAALKAAA